MATTKPRYRFKNELEGAVKRGTPITVHVTGIKKPVPDGWICLEGEVSSFDRWAAR